MEPGLPYPGSLPHTLLPQVDPSMEYHSREFNPLTACATSAACIASTADGIKSNDRIVQATLQYRAVLLDPAWNVNLYPGSAPFQRDFGDSFVYSVTMGDGATPFLFAGAGGESYVNIDLTVPGSLAVPQQAVPEPSTPVLALAGLGVFGVLGCRYQRRKIENQPQ